MRFEFYIVEAGPQASIQLREIQTARLEASREDAVQAVNDRFQELVSSNPEIGSFVVVSPTLGEPPGTIVAAEYIHAWPDQIRKRQGRPQRKLAWVVDDSTGLVAANN